MRLGKPNQQSHQRDARMRLRGLSLFQENYGQLCILAGANCLPFVPAEHVIPRNLGGFRPDLTLTRVFAKMQPLFRFETGMADADREHEGIANSSSVSKGRSEVLHRGVEPVIGESDDWKGARTYLHTDEDGNEHNQRGANVMNVSQAEAGTLWCKMPAIWRPTQNQGVTLNTTPQPD